MRYALIVPVLLLVALTLASAQPPGDPTGPNGGGTTPSVPDDTLFVFTPVSPLIDSSADGANLEDSYGIDVLFSNSGFGFGTFYQRSFSRTLAGFVNLGFTGSRNRDELDRLVEDPDNPGQYLLRVPGKVNRLYTMPLMVGLRYRLLQQVLVDNVRPYANIGVGPSLVAALPYDESLIPSIGDADLYIRPGGFIGVGVEVGGNRPILGVNIRYYYIPFKRGLESIAGYPIHDFGGLFLTANVGFPQ